MLYKDFTDQHFNEELVQNFLVPTFMMSKQNSLLNLNSANKYLMEISLEIENFAGASS